MIHSDKTMYIASRGQGKTFLTALFCVCMCILYPSTKIIVASATRPQANEVLLKIVDDFMKLHGWGSENLKREILGKPIVGTNKAVIEFKNGSWIRVVTASDSGRGARANVLVVDEFVKVDPSVINDVLKPFLTAPRQPNYLNNPKYSNLLEDNKELYMSSSWYASHWSYEFFQSFFANMFDETKKYFVCDLPYQLPIREGLLKKSKVEDDMSESTFDEVKFSMEYGGFWYGDTDGSFFTFNNISKQRKVKLPLYSPNLKLSDSKIKIKIPELELNERRILSLDVALMASKKNKNDASAIFINRAIPTNKNDYIGNIVFADTCEGKTTDELALYVRRLFDYYKCTDLVVDTAGRDAHLCSDT